MRHDTMRCVYIYTSASGRRYQTCPQAQCDFLRRQIIVSSQAHSDFLREPERRRPNDASSGEATRYDTCAPASDRLVYAANRASEFGDDQLLATTAKQTNEWRSLDALERHDDAPAALQHAYDACAP